MKSCREGNIINKKVISKWLSVVIAVAVVFQINALNIYALEEYTINNETQIETTEVYTESSNQLKEELSRNGNVVTEYTNEEDGRLKTIVWVQGITPPQMGGENSDFKREVTPIQGQDAKFVEYKSPFIPNQGWYDVNKTTNRDPDMNLCFAASASNTLHWWMAQNEKYIDQYLQEHPEEPKAERIKQLQNSFKGQQDSDIYKIFVRQFANRPDGYWPDILQDQFINGYYPKKNGGTNNSDLDRENLIQNGPDPNGGFFYNVIGTELLTERRYYEWGFDSISKDLKDYFVNGDIVLMTYSMKTKAHVVTLWGAEFDQNGQVSAVYFSDSDDDEPIGMQRYRIINVGNKAYATTRTDQSGGSQVVSLQVLSQGKKLWEDKLNISKKQLDLVWGETNLTYNGTPQKPTLTVNNIQDGDDVVVSVQGEKTDAGTYTATAVLSGTAADKYELPPQHTKTFTINKANPNITLNAIVENQNNVNTIQLNATVLGMNNETLNGTLTFKEDNHIIADNISVLNGQAHYSWLNPSGGNHNIIAEFFPSTEQPSRNYKSTISNAVSVDISKLEQTTFSINPITDKRYGDEPFVLTTNGGSGTGAVTFESSDFNVISISGNVTTIHKAGTAIITATKAGDEIYNSTTATYKIDVAKAEAPNILYPKASNLTYGQKLSDSILTEGSTEYGSFAWENAEIIPSINNQGYSVKFTPNSHTLENYEPIKTTTSIVTVEVNKANPTVNLSSNVIDEAGSKKVVLTASINKVGAGENPTGTVTFIDCTNGANTEIAANIAIEKGIATYIWTGMPESLYQIKAVYSGDENYNTISSPEIGVSVSKLEQAAFSINPIVGKKYGDAPFILTINGGSGIGAVTFESSDSNVISISGNVATIHKAGTAIITATKLGDENYNEAVVSTPIEVNKKILTIKAEDKLNIVQNAPIPQFTYTIDGLVNGDKFIVEPTIAVQEPNTSVLGEHQIMVYDGKLTNQDSYNIVYVNGKMTVVMGENGTPNLPVPSSPSVPTINSSTNIKPKPSNTEPKKPDTSTPIPSSNELELDKEDKTVDDKVEQSSSTPQIIESENKTQEKSENEKEPKNNPMALKVAIMSIVSISVISTGIFYLRHLGKLKFFKK